MSELSWRFFPVPIFPVSSCIQILQFYNYFPLRFDQEQYDDEKCNYIIVFQTKARRVRRTKVKNFIDIIDKINLQSRRTYRRREIGEIIEYHTEGFRKKTKVD